MIRKLARGYLIRFDHSEYQLLKACGQGKVRLLAHHPTWAGIKADYETRLADEEKEEEQN